MGNMALHTSRKGWVRIVPCSVRTPSRALTLSSNTAIATDFHYNPHASILMPWFQAMR